MYHPEHKETKYVGVFSYLKINTPVVTPIQPNPSPYYLVVPKKTNRALEGDLVYYEPVQDSMVEIKGIKERHTDHTRVVGVLQLNSPKRYGNTKRGLPIYNFIPLSWHYPNFMVASSVRAKWDKNVYIIAEFTEWTTNQKYPSARCTSVIGTITDPEAQDLALLNKNRIYIKRYPQSLPTPVPHPQPLPHMPRTDHTTDTILAIDPEGSKDLDDAFHIQENRIYVHIADVDDVFHSTDIYYESEIKKRMTSIYARGKVYNMLPSEFSDEHISLNCNGAKAAITVVLHKSPTGLQGINYYPSSIRLSKCLTYEKAQIIIDSPSNQSPTSQTIHALSQLTGHTDTHKMIEAIMVAANVYVGNVIDQQLRLPSLIRVMPPLPSTDDKGILSYLRYRGAEGARYQATNPTTPDPVPDRIHGGLNVSNYVHFTSPIRRYPDLIIHRILKDTGKYTYDELESLAKQLNSYNSQVKRYYRDSAIMTLSQSIPPDQVQHATGYIVDYNPETNHVYVYLPEYRIEYKYPLFNDSLQKIIAICDTPMVLHVTNKLSDKTYDIPKFEQLSVVLSVNPESIMLSGRVILRIEGLASLLF